MPTEPPPIDTFEVGWISAIECEYVAAQELLDIEYDDLPMQPNEETVFKLGKMGKHNVVLACLPKGEYGITPAASVARDMLRSFPKIRIGLMVGIAGAAPTKKNDVRLGDVVVSIGEGLYGGVVYYDHGKALHNGDFKETGSLAPPPRLLRNAAQRLATTHKRFGNKLDRDVEEMINKNERLRDDWTRPTYDVLYETDATHLVVEDQKCDESCKDKQVVNSRKERKDIVQIHHGLIASADKLVKDAKLRNKLAAEKNVLCFETEAAGLMNTFPCIVIRGICDYSDSHKNDDWQPYAAAIAACYAKQLLGTLPPSSVSAEATAREATEVERQEAKKKEEEEAKAAKANSAMPRHGGVLNNWNGARISAGRDVFQGGVFESKGDMHIGGGKRS